MAERIRGGMVGRRNERLINAMIEAVHGHQVSGPIHGTNIGSISASNTPFGQVIDQDSFRTTGHSLDVVVVKAGPNGEDDFTDGRYWAREIYLRQAAGATWSDAATLCIRGDGAWGCIHHLPEEKARTHSLVTFDAGTDTEDIDITASNVTVLRVNQVDGVVAGSGGENPGGDNGGNYLFTASGASEGFFPVYVKWVAGSDGDATTFASWTYDLYSDPDFTNKLNTIPLQPDRSAARVVEGKVTKAINGTVGIAYYNHVGTLKLWDCIETRSKFACS